MAAVQVSEIEWLNKTVVYSYNEVLFSNKKEQTADTYNIVDESQKLYTERSLTQKST